MINLLTYGTDSYKVSHWKQYPPKTNKVFLYLESRSSKTETLFFGLQSILIKYLSGTVVTQENINDAKRFYKLHFGSDDIFNEKGWLYILNKHNGKLPLEIKAVKEGTVVPSKNALITVVNTDPECYWLPGYIETLLLQVWYPTTVATNSYNMKKEILRYLKKSGDPTQIGFKLHDFGFRGSTSVESSSIGGGAHLVNFLGTDTLSALEFLNKYYGEECAGFSIPAAEHSTITSWGKGNEKNAYNNMLEQFPNSMVAVVSDSYDIYNAIEKIWGEELYGKVMQRNDSLVIRPDSGYPPKIVVECLELMAKKFGFTINSKGYKVLDPKVRLIQGDGIDYDMICKIQQALDESKFSGDNIAYGSGGGLLQKLNRDTFKFAIKCSAVEVDGKFKDVFKDPITDPGKKSKKGLMSLQYNSENKEWITNCGEAYTDNKNMLETVFLNGEIKRKQNLKEIRDLANTNL